MALVLTSPPALEPVTVVETKDHLRVDDSNEDVLLSSLILTSRLHIEAALSLALIDQGWTWTFDAWPKRSGTVTVPLRPVSAVSAINVLDEDGNPNLIPASEYELDGKHVPARLTRQGTPWPRPGKPHSGIEISFVAGFGPTPSDVPAPIRHALLLLVAHWYEHRDPIEIGSAKTSVPDAVSTLLQPFRVARL